MTNGSRGFSIACGFIVVLLISTTAGAGERVGSTPSLNIRVDDYASVADDLMAQAQDEVRQLYASIGVNTTWLETRRLSDGAADSPVVDENVADLTVIVLNPSMTMRMAPPDDVLGMAANTQEAGQGHIAYVFYDRLRTVTTQCKMSNVAALTFVMAHEIGHLLLPFGSHSDTGVMRGSWSRDTLRRLDVRRLQFTPLQGWQIRRVLNLR